MADKRTFGDGFQSGFNTAADAMLRMIKAHEEIHGREITQKELISVIHSVRDTTEWGLNYARCEALPGM